MIRKILTIGMIVVAAVILSAGYATASTVAQVQLLPGNTPGQTLDQNAIISAILTTPGATNGFTQTTQRWIFLVDDGTGSMDIFNPLSTFPAGYTPTIGDKITLTGRNNPFSGIPEMDTLTAISKVSSGNPVPNPLLKTISDVAGYTTAPAAGSPYPDFAGRLVTFNNLTLTGASGTFGTANITLTGTDTAANKLAVFYNPTTYSLPNANLFGKSVPTDPQNVTGIIQIFNNLPELIVMSMSPFVAPPPVGSVYWFPNGPTGAPGGAGTWNTTTTNWNTNSAGGAATAVAFSAANYANFGGAAGGAVTVAAGGVTTNGMEINANGYVFTGGPITLGGTPVAPDTVLNTIKVTNATDSAAINSQISGSNGLNKTGSGTLTLGSTTNNFTGNVTLSGGTLIVPAESSLGPTSNNIVLNAGTLKFSPSANVSLDPARTLTGNGGAIDVGAGKTLTIPGAVTLSGPLALPTAETVVLSGSSKSLGGVTFGDAGTLTAGTGTDTLTMNGNIAANNATGTAKINGSIDFGTSGRTISTTAGGTLVVTGGLTTNSSATTHIVVNGGGTLDVQGDNSAFINPLQIGTAGAAGPTIIAHDANSLGNVAFGTITEFFNSGTIKNQSGAPITFGSSVLSSIGGTGNFPATYAGNDMEFRGAINVFRPSGTATNHITVNNNTTFSGGWVATGDTGTFANNSGVVFDGTGSVTLSTTSGGNFNSLLVPIVADGGVTVNFNGVSPHFDGEAVTIGTANYTAKLQLGAKNGGRLNLSQANAFAGTSGPTPAPASVALESGGTLGTGGVDQSFGTLSLTGGGTLDLGATTGIVHFADSHTLSWTGTLNINNWTGNIAGGGAEELLFGNGLTGLTAAQLAAIHFTGFTTGAKFVAGGEIVPASSLQILLGDVNGDGHVNNADITNMMTALTDLNAYKSAHASFDPSIGDVNADGAFNNKDIQGLITYLQTGHGSTSAVPEPASLVLLGLAAPALSWAGFRRRRSAR